MRKGLLLLATALALAISSATAYADGLPYTNPLPGNPVGQPLPPNPFTQPHPYVNPFADPAWQPSRVDMGVDWVPARPLPVLAIGDALILGADAHAGWPGHRIIWYQLLDGSHAGDVVYVAENLRHFLRPGTYVRAGEKIAVALPSYPYTEWGWADSYGSPRAYPCYNVDGKQTRAGKEMARFMRSLGAQPFLPPGPGPDKPQGKRCS
jgi:hypothetical protein